jgi:hypothetical protein
MECVEFVAVQVAEIARVDQASGARTWRALIFATEFQGLFVDGIDFLLGIHSESDHHAVANGRGLAVKRYDDGQSWRLGRYRLGDEPLRFDGSAGADYGQQIVIKK